MMQSHRWHQGDVIKGELLRSVLQGSEEICDNCIAVIISHDCDLHREENYELIIGERLEALDKQLINARNPRRLHIAYGDDDDPLFIELRQDQKRTLPFSSIQDHIPEEKSHSLLDSEKRVLKQWLAARYGRPAFPDKFESELRKNFNSKLTVDRKIGSVLSKYSEYVSAVFFELAEDCKTELPPDELYILKIVIAIDSGKDIKIARAETRNAIQEIENIFFTVYGEPGNAKGIELELCSAILESEITLTMIRRMDQWRLEYISLGNEEESVITSGACALR